MALYIYRRAASEGANSLAEELDATRYRAKTMPLAQKVRRGDYVVAWGEEVPAIPGVNILNGGVIRSKFTDAEVLKAAGVSTIDVSRTRPRVEDRVVPAAADPAATAWASIGDIIEVFPSETGAVRSRVALDAANQLSVAVRTFLSSLNSPAPVATRLPGTVTGEWIPRNNDHVGGNDILTPTTSPDYFSKKETFVKEYRVHSFLGKSIRAGVKDFREGFYLPTTQQGQIRGGNVANSWVRSWDGGWRIKYDGVSSKKKHREIAHAAVEALGLQFGAVDIGEKADGSLVVLEVNRAPGLEGETIAKYAAAVTRWMEGATS